MATEEFLRNRIQELQKEIDELNRQQQQFQLQMNSQMEQNLIDLKRKYQESINRQKKETEIEYTKRIAQMQEEIAKENHLRYKSLEDKYQGKQKEMRIKLNELQDCNEQLRELLKNVKNKVENLNTKHKEYAEQLVEEVKKERQLVNESPHDYFFKGEFSIISSHMEDLTSEINQEMYQAAISSANSLILEFQLLQAKVNQALREWMYAFYDYKSMIEELMQRIELLEKQKIQTCVGNFVMNADELNFWSSGVFKPFKDKIEEANLLIQQIEKMGVENYLMKFNKNKVSIFTLVSDARRYIDEFCGISNCIINERVFSDQRWYYGKSVFKLLQNSGYIKKDTGFRKTNEYFIDLTWYPKGIKYTRNPLDSYDVIGTINDQQQLSIFFIPKRKDGVTYMNECVVIYEDTKLQNDEHIQSILCQAETLIRNIIPSIVVNRYSLDNGKIDAKKLENTLKKVPNPEEQIKLMERKKY